MRPQPKTFAEEWEDLAKAFEALWVEMLDSWKRLLLKLWRR